MSGKWLLTLLFLVAVCSSSIQAVTPPTSYLISPIDAVGLAGPVNFTANCTETGTAKLYINKKNNGTVSVTANAKFNFTRALGDGSYNWTIECTDAYGNKANATEYLGYSNRALNSHQDIYYDTFITPAQDQIRTTNALFDGVTAGVDIWQVQTIANMNFLPERTNFYTCVDLGANYRINMSSIDFYSTTYNFINFSILYSGSDFIDYMNLSTTTVKASSTYAGWSVNKLIDTLFISASTGSWASANTVPTQSKSEYFIVNFSVPKKFRTLGTQGYQNDEDLGRQKNFSISISNDTLTWYVINTTNNNLDAGTEFLWEFASGQTAQYIRFNYTDSSGLVAVLAGVRAWNMTVADLKLATAKAITGATNDVNNSVFASPVIGRTFCLNASKYNAASALYEWSLWGQNVTTNAKRSFSVSRPAVRLVSPSIASTLADPINFTANCSQTGTAKLYINKKNNGTVSVTANAKFNFTRSLGNGNFNWTVECTDQAGNKRNGSDTLKSYAFNESFQTNTTRPTGLWDTNKQSRYYWKSNALYAYFDRLPVTDEYYVYNFTRNPFNGATSFTYLDKISMHWNWSEIGETGAETGYPFVGMMDSQSLASSLDNAIFAFITTTNTVALQSYDNASVLDCQKTYISPTTDAVLELNASAGIWNLTVYNAATGARLSTLSCNLNQYGPYSSFNYFGLRNFDGSAGHDIWGNITYISFAKLTDVERALTVQNNLAPTINTKSILPSVIYRNTRLNASFNVTDSDVGNNLNVTIKWFTNGRRNTTAMAAPTNGTFRTVTKNALYKNTTAGILLNKVVQHQSWIAEVAVTDGIEITKSNTTAIKVLNRRSTFNQTIGLVNKTYHDTINLKLNATDLDGDNCTFTDNTTLFAIGSTTGIITDTPTLAEAGRYQINLTCNDGFNTSSTAFTYRIQNNSVVNFNSRAIAPTAVYRNTAMNATFNLTDPNTGDYLNLTVKWFTNNRLNSTYTLSQTATPFIGLTRNLKYKNSSGGVPINKVVQTQTWIAELTAWDGANSKSVNTTAIKVLNRRPTFNQTIGLKNVTYHDTIRIRLNISDLDGDNVTYADNTTLFNINASGWIVDTPTLAQAGRYRINLTINDTFNISTTAFTYLVQNNTAPKVNTIAVSPTIAYRNRMLNASFNVTDANLKDMLNVTIKWFTNNRLNSTYGVNITNTPFLNLTRNLRYNNNSGGVSINKVVQTQTWIAELSLYDGVTTIKQNSSAIKVLNRRPTFNQTFTFVNRSAISGPLRLQVNVTDDDGDNVTFSDNSTQFTIGGTGGYRTYTDAGRYSINLTVSDGFNTSSFAFIYLVTNVTAGDTIVVISSGGAGGGGGGALQCSRPESAAQAAACQKLAAEQTVAGAIRLIANTILGELNSLGRRISPQYPTAGWGIFIGLTMCMVGVLNYVTRSLERRASRALDGATEKRMLNKYTVHKGDSR